MITPTTLSEQLLFTTVLIETNLGAGTGFFFNYPVDKDRSLHFIITNKHVIRGATTGTFALHEEKLENGIKMPSGRSFRITLDNLQERWFSHPNDNVDLCALSISLILDEALKQNKKPFYTYFDLTHILSDESLPQLSAVEEILMVGYPIGLYDKTNNLPLIRRGITSSHPAIDFDGNNEFVIDAACFPGSSGSPVVIANEGIYTSKQGTTAGVSRLLLLGTLCRGPVLDLEGNIRLQTIPTSNPPTAHTKIMIHLGFVIKAKEVIFLCEHIKKYLLASGQLVLEEGK